MPHLPRQRPRLPAAVSLCLTILCAALFSSAALLSCAAMTASISRAWAAPRQDEPRFVAPPAGETPEAAALIGKAQSALSAGRATAEILADPVYMPVHAHTRFRTLIRDNARSPKTVLVTPQEPGEPLEVTGIVRDAAGRPSAGTLIYVYQTSAKGWYSDLAPHLSGMGGDTGHARLFGYMTTGSDGGYQFRTVRPAGYPRSDLPAHIHVHIDPPAGAGRPLVTEIQFEDDARLTKEWRERSRADGFVITTPRRDAAGLWHVTAEFTLR